MNYQLVISEKPSVAQAIAKVLGANKRQDGYLEGNGYLVSWCVGHLVELAMPESYDEKYSRWRYDDLPILPDKWKYQVSTATRKQFNILKTLMKRDDVTELVNACDSGREGELIFRLVYHQCGCKKPFQRLWISSMEDSAIREGFAHLKTGKEYDALYEAALCRERADWIVGMNATRLFSCLYGQTLNVGRVMTPTLAMVVMRDADIAAFKPEPFYTVHLQLQDFVVSSPRIKEKHEAEDLHVACQANAVAVVTKTERKEKSEKPPAPYDLTSLQREANKILGFTAQQTLDYTQSLYEKKLVTYPRTDSRYLTDDMEETIPALVQIMTTAFGITEMIPIHSGQIINGKKVTDHYAIIPTRELQNCKMQELPAGEVAILQLIVCRLLEAAGDIFRYAETVVETICANTVFSSKGREVIALGWKRITEIFRPKRNEKESEILPSLQEGQPLQVKQVSIKEGQTSSTKHYTEDTLLLNMEKAGDVPDESERQGIGTPATRAGVIEKLVQKGFVERRSDKKNKFLQATDKGTALVTVIPEQIQSASMTADWEKKLLEIERGEYDADDFMKEICEMITALVGTYEAVKGADVFLSPKGKVIGNCPACGCEVSEQRKGWFCSNKNCQFALWKDNNYFKRIHVKMTSSLAEQLVKHGYARLSGCQSERTGKYFDCKVVMTAEDSGRPVYQLEFDR